MSLNSLALDDPAFALVDGKTRPEFMLVGGMKCGSTSFAKYLSVHPQVRTPGPKEPHYWSWRRFPARYQTFFVNESPVLCPGSDQFVSGEFSTSSLIHPLAPRRVRANLPGLRIFALLRNPVDRAYSHFIMSRRAGLEKECTFEEIVRSEMDEVPELLAAHERCFLGNSGDSKACYSKLDGSPITVAGHEQGFPRIHLKHDADLRDFYFKSYVFRSLYHDQLHRWLRLFPGDQIMIIQSERLFENPAETMSEAAQFLGLDRFDFESSGELHRSWDAGAKNVADAPESYAPMKDSTRSLLAEFFEPHNRRLFDLAGRHFDWN